MPYKDPLKSKEAALRCRRKNSKRWYQERIKRPGYKEKQHKWSKDFRERQRTLVLEHYGNKCACCGEIIRCFLTIDHKNNDGRKHRKHSDSWIIKHHYPEDLQILCWNCNWGRRMFGVCPHQGGGKIA